jgi:hypothetical protein
VTRAPRATPYYETVRSQCKREHSIAKVDPALPCDCDPWSAKAEREGQLRERIRFLARRC